MSRPSPQTDRVMEIVNVLTARAAGGATLSEIAAVIGQTPSTLVHVLGSLTAGGFVVRRPSDRRYHLGPALIDPGRIAAGRFPTHGETRAAIEELARAEGYGVFAFALDGDHARLIDAAWDPRRPSPTLRIGDLLPIDPPVGSAFIAWGGPEHIDGWMRRGSPSAEARAVIVERLAASRAQGYVVTLRPPPQLQDELRRFVDRGQHLRRAERLRASTRGIDQYLAGRIDRRRSYDVSSLSVPVIAREQTV
ncbi:MAG: transcriptional regulator, IclR family, partial [Ilumatobacteraceae bacterium]|nr:transcriptional regulator, IclR family [Ilumatobacteraceae bacterium]